jgi:hypothetical protein
MVWIVVFVLCAIQLARPVRYDAVKQSTGNNSFFKNKILVYLLTYVPFLSDGIRIDGLLFTMYFYFIFTFCVALFFLQK